MCPEDARLIWESWRETGCSHVPFMDRACCNMTQSFEIELEKIFGNTWYKLCQKVFRE